MSGVAEKKTIKVRNPLEPLSTFNGIALRFLVLGAVWGIVGSALGRGSFLGWGAGRGDICVTDTGIDSGAQSGSSEFIRPHIGVAMDAVGLRICTDKPTAGQRWWYSLEQLPGTVTLIAVVLTTYLALRQAQRHGLYTPGIPSKLRFLGWFLIAGSVAWPTVQTIAAHRLWATMADSQMSIQWNPEWVGLFAGLALLSLARIMRVGSAMREDLEGVV